MKFESPPLGEIARFLKKFCFELHRRLIDRAEHSLDRLHESCRAVFHARSQIEAASPGLAVSMGTGTAEGRDKDKPQCRGYRKNETKDRGGETRKFYVDRCQGPSAKRQHFLRDRDVDH